MLELVSSHDQQTAEVEPLPYVLEHLLQEMPASGIEVGYDHLQVTITGDQERIFLLTKALESMGIIVDAQGRLQGSENASLEQHRQLGEHLLRITKPYIPEESFESHYEPMIRNASQISSSGRATNLHEFANRPRLLGAPAAPNIRGLAQLRLRLSFHQQEALAATLTNMRETTNERIRFLRAVA